MSYNGTEGGPISLKEGGEMTANYRENNPDQLLGHFFGKDILNEILAQEGCMGIRMYYGEDADGVKQLVIVGAQDNENDMTQLVADGSRPCPPCGNSNALNS